MQYMRVGESTDDAGRDLLTRLFLAVVDAGDDPVGLGEALVGEIHVAVFQNVALDSLEDDEALFAELFVRNFKRKKLRKKK